MFTTKNPDGVVLEKWVGVCGSLPKTLTLFMTKMVAKWLKLIP